MERYHAKSSNSIDGMACQMCRYSTAAPYMGPDIVGLKMRKTSTIDPENFAKKLFLGCLLFTRMFHIPVVREISRNSRST